MNELEAEGELEEQKELDKQLLDVGPTVGLPEVPSADLPVPKTKTKAKATEEDDEMAELAAWAS